MSDQVNDLKQLEEMHANGSLSDEEFTEAKRKLLDRDDPPPQPQPQPTTVVHTQERSGFGSVVIGGLLVIALIALIFWFFNNMADNSDSADPINAPGAGAQQGGAIEIDVPSLPDVEEGSSETVVAE